MAFRPDLFINIIEIGSIVDNHLKFGITIENKETY